MREMTEKELEQEQENERLNGCCECGEPGHGCNDCPVFDGPGSPPQPGTIVQSQGSTPITGIVLDMDSEDPRYIAVAWLDSDRGAFWCYEYERDLTVAGLSDRNHIDDPPIDHDNLAAAIVALIKKGQNMKRFTVTIVANGQDESRVVEADCFENGDDGLVRFYRTEEERGAVEWGDKVVLVHGVATLRKLVLAVPTSNVTGIEPRP